MNNTIGKIKRVSLREVWKHEANDLTQWLENNIDVLNDVIDLNLLSAEREKAAGSFNVDLVAEDDSGNLVVIENQMGKSDHDHLGKLITYLSVIGATVAVWIVANPRPEHVSAISRLNESSLADFYLLKLEAIQIGESAPAPLLTLITGPSEEGREVGKTKKDIAERYILRKNWWIALLDRARNKTKLHANISAGQYDWVGVSAGKRGLNYNYVVNQHSSKIELYIDLGKESKEDNEAIFNALQENRNSIEETFGEQLSWEKLETKRACRIAKYFSTGGYRDDEEEWPYIQEEIIEAMIRFEKALAPHIKKLKTQI